MLEPSEACPIDAQGPVSHTASSRTGRSGAEEAGLGPSLAFDPQERIETLLAHLGTRSGGLSEREAERRLAQFGPNEIFRTRSAGRLLELVRQFVHPLALLLWVAAGLSALSGNRTLAIAIVAVIVLNAALA